jgi:hypothetical protein
MTGAEYASVHGGTFDGETVAANAVVVKYTYYGDTDFNGIVNFDDYVRTDSRLQQPPDRVDQRRLRRQRIGQLRRLRPDRQRLQTPKAACWAAAAAPSSATPAPAEAARTAAATLS